MQLIVANSVLQVYTAAVAIVDTDKFVQGHRLQVYTAAVAVIDTLVQ